MTMSREEYKDQWRKKDERIPYAERLGLDYEPEGLLQYLHSRPEIFAPTHRAPRCIWPLIKQGEFTIQYHTVVDSLGQTSTSMNSEEIMVDEEDRADIKKRNKEYLLYCIRNKEDPQQWFSETSIAPEKFDSLLERIMWYRAYGIECDRCGKLWDEVNIMDTTDIHGHAHSINSCIECYP